MRPPTHSKLIAYITWILGVAGMHRFYLGRPVSGLIWLVTGGLLGIGWVIDAFLIPSMVADANHRFTPGRNDYTITWILLVFLGYIGLHRFYLGRWATGLLWLFTLGLGGIGWLYDLCNLNTQIDRLNSQR